MGQEVVLNNKYTVAKLMPDSTLMYDQEVINTAIKEMIEDQPSKGGFLVNMRVVYRWDRDRRINNDQMFKLWKRNPLIQNRIIQLNALVFGRGLKWIYEKDTQDVVDRFWRVNRLRSKLSSISTDAQLYGEVFIALYPQMSGDTLIAIYESNQVDIEYDAGNVSDVIKYYVKYYDEDKRKEEKIEFQPIDKYLNSIEFENVIRPGIGNRMRHILGLRGRSKIKGKGVMCHIKFNNASSEIHGTSDFKQIYDIIEDYMNFVGDRLTIHQLYGSPAYDITIDTEDPLEIDRRIQELAGFAIGSNPVHNTKETWKALEFEEGALNATNDEHILRGLLCAGFGFPEYLLFNQSETNGSDNAFALTKIAEDRQDIFRDMLQDIHKVVMCIAGKSPIDIDDGQIVFPAVNTMTEKQKAETYLLTTSANICSRKTAAMGMGHNWDIELEQMLKEYEALVHIIDPKDPINNNSGRTGGYQSTHNADKDADSGTDDKDARLHAQNVGTQTMGERKTND